MPYLLIAALIAIGVWQYRRYQSGLPALPGAKPVTPEQVVRAEIPPALQNAILDLIYNGRDPQSMHDMASELEKYGFFDAAMLLHKRADVLATLQRQVDAVLVARGLNPAIVSPALREAILQEVMRAVPVIPTSPIMPTPQTTQTALEVAMQELRNEVGALDTEYGALDRQIRALTSSPPFVNSWNQQLTAWRSFALIIERVSAQVTQSAIANYREDFGLFRDALIARRAEYARELGIQSSVPQAPPGPVAQAEVPAGTVPTRFSSRGTVLRSPVLNLRSNPDDVSAIVISAPVGSSIVVTNSSGNYYLVTYQSQSGWARKTDVSIAANPPSTVPGGGIRRGAL